MVGAQDLAQDKAGLDNVETRARHLRPAARFPAGERRHPRWARVRPNLAVARLKPVARPEERVVELVQGQGKTPSC
jgi:hypothetical protein